MIPLSLISIIQGQTLKGQLEYHKTTPEVVLW